MMTSIWMAVLGIVLQARIAAPPEGIIDLTGPWRFRTGDTAAFASPALSDTAWSTMIVPGDWSAAGAPDYRGFGWYRLRYTVDSLPHEPLGLRLRAVATAYDVYVDGLRLGGVGGLPPRYRARAGIPVVFGLPTVAQLPGEHLIAVRVYSAESSGGLVGPVSLGSLKDLVNEERRRDYSLLATALLLLGIGLYQIFFWLRRPQALEHLYIFLSCLALAGFFVSWMPSVRLFLEPAVNWYRPYLSFAAASLAAFGFAFRRIFELDDDRVLAGLSVLFLVLIPVAVFAPASGQVVAVGRWLLYPAALLWGLTVVVLAALQTRHGVTHARPLLWGTLILLATLVHDILADWGVQLVHSTFSWLILFGAIAFVASLAMTTATKFVETETAALYDRLTGLYRREVVLDALAREIRRAARVRQPLAVIMLDVDRFKQINDTLGHQAGDRVLAEIGRRMTDAGRAVDWLGRYGGEEFLAVLAATSKAGAVLAAERLRAAVSALPIATGRTARTVTLSAGVAAFEGGEWPTTETLVGAADTALYRAKNDGRNCVRD
jgi:diguanylate cyclase (GGDEF)-like protein